MQARLQAALDRAAEIERELADPVTARSPTKLRTLGREHARLERIRRAAEAFGKLEDELAQAHEMARDTDPEMADLARADVATLEPRVEAAERELLELLVPPDPLDERDAIVEIRAGTGGDEAALFAADLFRMYTRYAERNGWTKEPVSLSEGNVGGLKEVVFAVRGGEADGSADPKSGTDALRTGAGRRGSVTRGPPFRRTRSGCNRDPWRSAEVLIATDTGSSALLTGGRLGKLLLRTFKRLG